MWYAGIDWADEHHVVVVLDEQGQQVATKQVTHTVEGLAQLTTFLLGIAGTPERLEELACIIETNHGLLIAALLEAGLPYTLYLKQTFRIGHGREPVPIGYWWLRKGC